MNIQELQVQNQELRNTLSDLLDRTASLYTAGTLVQYHLSEDQALRIVSDVTGLTPERLVEMKQQRDSSISRNMDMSDGMSPLVPR